MIQRTRVQDRGQAAARADGRPERRAADVEHANAAFWNELCGSSLARSLGIRDHSPASLERFDRAYLAFYPYLADHVKLASLAGSRVLEIGIGYGTLGQRIAGAGAEYVGIDIADAPAHILRYRLQACRLPGSSLRGSALRLPFRADSMDYVVSIGCLHHTGDIQQGIAEIHRVLKPGGRALLMVYNQFSYRQWMRWPIRTLCAWLHGFGFTDAGAAVTEAQRRAYDSGAKGQAAPVTIFLSIRQLRRLLGAFSRVAFQKENNETLFGVSRTALLPYLGRAFGLDIYVEAEK